MIQRTALAFFAVFCVCLVSSTGELFAKNKPDSINVITGVVKDASSLKGKVVYVDFWASWCGPCRRSFPWLKDISARYEAKGFKVVTINLDRDRSAAKKFIEEMKLPFEVFYDSTGAIAEKFGIEAIPSSYLYGRDGILKSEHRGFNPAKGPEMDSLISKLLMEGPKK